MESVTVSRFKATCLSILNDVQKQKKRVIITKRGKPIAEVVPYLKTDRKVSLKNTVTFMGDIVSPVAEGDWEVLK
jgi:prevent-host-death family protein